MAERKRSRRGHAIDSATREKISAAKRKWTDADWDAAIEILATQLDTSLTKMRPANLPSYHTVCKRSSTDARVKALLAAAIARRKEAFTAAGLRWRGAKDSAVTFASGVKYGRGLQYSDAAYSEYLERLKANETAKTHADAIKLFWPGLPTFYSVMRRRKDELRAILRTKGLLKPQGWALVNGAPVFSAETYAKAVALISTMSLMEYSRHRESNTAEKLPSAQAIFKRADRNPRFAAELYSVRPKVERTTFRYSDETYEAAISKIGEVGWNAYLADCEPGIWPSLNAIYKRTRSDKEFKERLNGKTRERYRLKRQLKGLTARRRKNAPATRPDGQLGFLLLQQEAYRVADGFVPRHYDRSDRDDIKQDIVAAVLTREIEIDEIGENAKWFISEHFRGGVFSSGKFASLDAPVFEDSDVAFVDRLSSDDYSHIG
ncbi:hypothetical protein ACVWWI_003348 [Bradyrhizobium sp. USDA 3686]|uniref:hypothetical protein n=1 Tax=Bradyrhizobium canariense TaxID=255045 RepID=UPI00195937FA|nr:hypothetical protein [Bradyrhizobium canariense]MBM7483336.1 hypothetical protein [Bradyrhizobium canariense]